MKRNFQQILLSSRLDLDALYSAFLWRIDPRDPNTRAKIRFIGGSASGDELSNPSLLKIEVGGSGRTETFCFDHHCSVHDSRDQQHNPLPCAAVQVADYLRLEHRLPPSYDRILAYVDAIDFGRDIAGNRRPLPAVGWPRLLDLVNGMRLVVEAKRYASPHEKLLAILEGGYQIFEAVAQAGLNPCAEPVTDMLWLLEHGDQWVDAKLTQAKQLQTEEIGTITTDSGLVLGVLESNSIGMPKDLYKRHGIDAIVARCPEFRVLHEDTELFVPKYTICVHGDWHARGYTVSRLLQELQLLEQDARTLDWEGRLPERGWGHPCNNTSMALSDRYTGSILSLQQVVASAIAFL